MHTLPTLLYNRLLRPVTATDDSRRREVILNILLLASIALAALAWVLDLIHRTRSGLLYDGINSLVVPTILLLFIGLLSLSRSGIINVPAYVLIGIYYLTATYSIASWGIIIPQGMLIFALVITLSCILTSARTAFLTTVLVIATLVTVQAMISAGQLHPDLRWLNEKLNMGDIMISAVTLIVIFFVSWLSKREIDHSFQRAYALEETLIKERDSLEETVKSRTSELRQAQREEILKLYEVAELGKLSSDLLHDLLNPLCTVALTLEQFQTQGGPELIDRAVRNTKWIERFVETARKQINKGGHISLFSLNNEAREAVNLLSDRLRNTPLSIQLDMEKEALLYGDPIKFHRLITNLVVNAIDASEGIKRGIEPQEIWVCLEQRNQEVILSVTDYGSGISAKNLEQVFEPFFTTKSPDKGTGVGLAICKQIVEQDFGGRISLESVINQGTTVRATLHSQRPKE